MTTALITGGSGLVGSAVIRRFQLDNSIKTLLSPSHAELDLLNTDDVAAYIKRTKPNTVIHCAGHVSGIIGNTEDQYGHFVNNIVMGINLINAAFKAGVPNLVNLGSTCIYPADTKQPITERSLLTGSLESTNEGYAVAKIACVKLCEYISKEYGLNYISCMPTNVFGPGDKYDIKRSHVFPALAHKILTSKGKPIVIGGTGKPIRSFIHSDDLADAIHFCLKNYHDSSPINIGAGMVLSISELATLLTGLIGVTPNFIYDTSIPDGVAVKIEDHSKLFALGWRPKYTNNTGIRHYLHNLKETIENEELRN